MAVILVVDDDPAARELMSVVLGYAGHDVRTATDGADALARAEADEPDLVIADLLMPTMDGFEFVRRLREVPSLAKTPVAFYTASYLESEARSLADACGVTHIITKPSEPEEILRVVRSVLGAPHVAVAAPAAEEFREAHVSLLTAKLSQKNTASVPRLAAMVDLGLAMASERDPERVLEQFCAAARKIIGAKYAVVGVLDDKGRKLRYRFASGMSSTAASRIMTSQVPTPMMGEVLAERRPRRLRSLQGDPLDVGLPAKHPPVHSFLCAPIVSPERSYGWLCLGDKVGAIEFSEEDESLVQILAAHAGRVYENGALYAEVKQLNAGLEQRVAERTAELKAANEQLESFSYSVSHDLRNPLFAVQGMAQLLQEKYASALDAKAQNYVKLLIEGTAQMDELIKDILAFSRSGLKELRVEDIEPAEIVRRALDDLRADMKGRRVDVEIADLPRCKADPALLRQVYVNLISNALKYSRTRDAARIEIGARDLKGECAYFVKDNGVGFDPKLRARLFIAFQRLHSSRDFKGTGVGLALVRRIIERHHGRVWADSAVGKGATFYFTVGAPRAAS